MPGEQSTAFAIIQASLVQGSGARESWGLRSSHCRAEETSPRRVSGT